MNLKLELLDLAEKYRLKLNPPVFTSELPQNYDLIEQVFIAKAAKKYFRGDAKAASGYFFDFCNRRNFYFKIYGRQKS